MLKFCTEQDRYIVVLCVKIIGQLRNNFSIYEILQDLSLSCDTPTPEKPTRQRCEQSIFPYELEENTDAIKHVEITLDQIMTHHTSAIIM